MKTVLQAINSSVLFLALELSNKKWKLGFSNGIKNRIKNIDAGDWLSLRSEIKQAREKLNMMPGCQLL